jgi:type I restriction enzyme S subunit
VKLESLESIVENRSCSYGEELGAYEHTYPVAKVSNVGPEGEFKGTFEQRSFPYSQLDSLLVDEGDLLVVKSSGSSLSILSGKTAFCDKHVAKKLVPSNFLLNLRPLRECVWPRYLWYYLNSKQAKQFVARIVGATTYPNIKWSSYKAMQVPLPPLPEQRRIADILDKADAIRRKRQEVSASLGDYPLALFMEMFGHPDPNPKNWPMHSFSKVCDSRLGKMLDAKQQTGQHNRPYMRNLNVQWGRIDLSQVFEMDFDVSDREEFRLKYGDVLVCEGGAGVGQTAIWRDEIPECYFQKSLHRVRPVADKATPEYIAFLMWTLMKGSSLLRSISSATIPHLTGEKLKDVRIPVPPLKLQQHFTKQCQQIAVIKAKAVEGVTGANELFNSLVQRAFRGEL